ncbi:MAG: hypothetical protein UX31_C0017G0024 [Candidatus Nomurabacteria bacterium GW2011_GWA1_46_11]|uniref:Uncharacterized protein n=2 Tax=Parcubacteria group TaxID=1794811 RepID=A0A1G1YWN5_9BACT|nr:MAG: hypothetical protein UX29_C0016G0017 [Parcubacteria group bacterium GW2011_GWA2_46_10]KKU21440.1 MAG: hypothetical protein UX31_C0017G0024 [Candidatus Nomurabacteria bacterium GW2011_GWA1_46_11]OGY56798.1 MAG: hypothetical protein A2119_01970 [Candidatus Colwellbacteria bacterium GWA2_46_10]
MLSTYLALVSGVLCGAIVVAIVISGGSMLLVSLGFMVFVVSICAVLSALQNINESLRDLRSNDESEASRQ